MVEIAADCVRRRTRPRRIDDRLRALAGEHAACCLLRQGTTWPTWTPRSRGSPPAITASERCGQPVAGDRLLARPTARTCISCASAR
ncbi:TraR/DksA C4-type zinc finger protein [Promicromonospora iranensis]|uniref:TraR/DksA C4-type zinc finger protein n=1 Tax=Promicromonospora iranensis TaxID=1105144 RepID=UPI0031591A4B